MPPFVALAFPFRRFSAKAGLRLLLKLTPLMTEEKQTTATRPALIYFAAAFGAGCLLAMMTHMNGVVTQYGNALYSSWTAHGIGTLAAVIILSVQFFRRSAATRPTGDSLRGIPWWAYLGGVSGAATVVFASLAVNSPLALSGTIALGLGGQVLFSLAADYWGFFGLPARKLDMRDLLTVTLILMGSLLIILSGASQ